MWLGARSPRQNASALCQLAKNGDIAHGRGYVHLTRFTSTVRLTGLHGSKLPLLS